MRILLTAAVLFILALGSFSQSDLQKVIDTENAFARAAYEKGSRSAFLEYLSADSVVFSPERANGREVWTARKGSPALLSWYPVYADISSNGMLGYTTGPWEYRPKGKDDAPVAFGHYMTIWQKQPDGNFKAVLDIGVSHDRPDKLELKLTTANMASPGDKGDSHAGDAAAAFFDLVSHVNILKAYKEYAADDIRMLRDSKVPIVGKKAVLKEIAEFKGTLSISRRMSFYGSGDIAYATNSYTVSEDGKAAETGNFVQIWKSRKGKWQIVMDIFIAAPKNNN